MKEHGGNTLRQQHLVLFSWGHPIEDPRQPRWEKLRIGSRKLSLDVPIFNCLKDWRGTRRYLTELETHLFKR